MIRHTSLPILPGMRRNLFGLLILLLGVRPAISDPLEQAFEKSVHAVAETGRHIAFAAGYAVGADAPITQTRGDKVRGGDPVGAHAPWHIGSISKGFTAALVMQLVEAGRLNLDAPIARYLPDHAPAMDGSWAALTLRALLSHTAGLRPNFFVGQMMSGYGPDLPAARLARLQAHWGKPVKGKPGAFAYSNLGYVLVGVVLEQVTAVPWETLVIERIGKPFGLASMGVGPPTASEAAWGHRKTLLGLRATDPAKPGADNPAWLGPAGTLHLSLADLLRWGQMHLLACKGELPDFLSAQSCQTLRAPVDKGYGLGWQTETFAGHAIDLVGHEGSNTMWVAHLSTVPERDMVFAFATNDGRYAGAAKSVLILGEALAQTQAQTQAQAQAQAR